MSLPAGRQADKENVPPPSAGSVFCSVENREPSQLGRTEAASNMLGSFRIKVLLQGTVFLLHKRPNIFIVLT